MTTLVRITNCDGSNGDLILNAVNAAAGDSVKDMALRPRESCEIWLHRSSALFITETCPTRPKNDDPGGGKTIAECGDQGDKWAKAFVNQFPNADEDTMRAWFANAIEAADIVRNGRRTEAVSVAELRELREKAWKYDELSK